ncbi:MAG TPA: hypothetical protein VFM82_08480 [Flavobacteriaceae bacterium]|nr:hypothetical protein [Flavobacteriaceae bacterium]
MSEKFKELPVEQGTNIIAHFETNLGKYEVVYEKWVWSGIYAESVIFLTKM